MDFLDILKWIGIVLAAGFVGYFGRYLAMLILDRVHSKKQQSRLTPEKPDKERLINSDIKLEEARFKIEKKKAKAQAKRSKKT